MLSGARCTNNTQFAEKFILLSKRPSRRMCSDNKNFFTVIITLLSVLIVITKFRCVHALLGL